MNAMASSINPPPPHSRRVQAWVYTILNPAIEALRRELVLLNKGNLTWRFYSKKCEYIRPFAEYIEGTQLPNFEDFLADALNAGFKPRIDAHDGAVVKIEADAARFFDGLMQSPLFLKEIASALDEYKSAVREKPQYPDADSIGRDLSKYVAEYLINRTDFLPDHYLTHKFWAEFRKKFDLSAMDFEPYQQRESFQALKRSSDVLKRISEDFLAASEKHRYWLCSTYDIPAAPIPTEISHSADAYVTRTR